MRHSRTRDSKEHGVLGQFLGTPTMSTLSKVVNFNCEHNNPVNELAVYVYVQRVLYPRHAVHMHLLKIVRLFSDIADCQPPVANFLSQVYFSVERSREDRMLDQNQCNNYEVNTEGRI